VGGVISKILLNILIVLCSVLCSCFLSPEEDTVHQTDQIILGFSPAEIVDNDEFSRYTSCMSSIEHTDSCFFLVESPEYLDSIFYIEYLGPGYSGPKLEDLFPEDGMLLVYFDEVWSSSAYISHEITLSADTVFIDIVLKENPNLKDHEKGIYYFIIPIGIVPE
jgi:hypothetical protein